MSSDQEKEKSPRIEIDDLPEEPLAPEDAEDVKGGMSGSFGPSPTDTKKTQTFNSDGEVVHDRTDDSSDRTKVTF